LKFNPVKCSFRVKSEKLLGFVESSQGIEIDPDKVKAIQVMPALKKKKSKRFLGSFELHCLVYISDDINL